jgi:hypothetical protein
VTGNLKILVKFLASKRCLHSLVLLSAAGRAAGLATAILLLLTIVACKNRWLLIFFFSFPDAVYSGSRERAKKVLRSVLANSSQLLFFHVWTSCLDRSMDGFTILGLVKFQSLKFWVSWRCRMGCLNANKKQITESVSKLRDEFIKGVFSSAPKFFHPVT